MKNRSRLNRLEADAVAYSIVNSRPTGQGLKWPETPLLKTCKTAQDLYDSWRYDMNVDPNSEEMEWRLETYVKGWGLSTGDIVP